MTYNVTGKRIRTENLAGQVTATAWDYLDCIPVGELNSAVKEAGVAEYAYEHAPFGALTISRGESAASNPWRFSSEFAEDDTATVYYNYRHYEPVMGRWMNREEFSIDSLNPYMQLGNHSIRTSDRLGLYDELFHFYLMYLIMNDMFGGPDSNASNLAFAYAQGSQMPDSGMFDAMRGKVSPSETNLRIRRLYHNLNSLTCCHFQNRG